MHLKFFGRTKYVSNNLTENKLFGPPKVRNRKYPWKKYLPKCRKKKKNSRPFILFRVWSSCVVTFRRKISERESDPQETNTRILYSCFRLTRTRTHARVRTHTFNVNRCAMTSVAFARTVPETEGIMNGRVVMDLCGCESERFRSDRPRRDLTLGAFCFSRKRRSGGVGGGGVTRINGLPAVYLWSPHPWTVVVSGGSGGRSRCTGVVVA